ncbi:hypothetical protein J0X19_05120 [Hymenobacter sp. BT186]|uniref:DUF2750 domain-containing protein n=1 Tax=Hymenobacter telluris TaxID=2816474 RepID=A0A939EU91_9BACT|nr:hypothetical protein [Hymenobacter telluris]MBO0357317.1 hypothetical protein [Hymenobacter telluris]MBW3373343.1 hypothetical protein [Hymenobacter norwichensis]
MALGKKQLYSRMLAEQVAAALQTGRTLAAYHRDYCGMGLECVGGQFFYGEVWDGRLRDWNTLENREAFIVDFPDQSAFVAWLSAQSDATLNCHEMPLPFYWDNQTITQQRLEAFVTDAPCNARPAWYQAMLYGNEPVGSEITPSNPEG